mgnify:CR=1 FL=1
MFTICAIQNHKETLYKYIVLKGKESYDFMTGEKIELLKIAPRYLRLKFSNGDIKSFSFKDSSTFVEIE